MKRIYLLIFFLSSILCANSQAILSEGFEGAFPPAGWTILKTGNGNNWTSNTDAALTDGPYASHSGAGSMIYEYSVAAAANAWAITPSLNLTGGVSYSISFYYRIRSATYPEKLKVTVGNAATIAAQSTVIWNNNGGSSIANTAWQLGVATYTPATTGTFNFAFNCYSNVNQWATLVDDVTIEATPSAAPGCTTNSTPVNNATGVTLNPLTLTWHPADSASSYDVYIGTTNPPTGLITTVSDTTAVLTGGAFNTVYYWYVVPRNAAGAASGCVSSVTSFTTSDPPVAPDCADILAPANGATNVDVEPVFTWNTTAGATSYIFSLGTANPPDTLGVVTDTTVSLTQPLAFNTTYYWSVTPQNGGGTASGCLAYSFTTRAAAAIPPNDEACDAITLTLNGSSDCQNTEGATAGASDTLDCSTENNTVWYKYTPTANGSVSLKMKRIPGAAKDLNAWLGVFTVSGTCPDLSFAQQFDCYSADLTANDSVMIVTGPLVAGTPYYIMIDGFSGAFGEYCISLVNPPAPPACVTVKAPADGATNVNAPATTFSWNASPDALSYSLYLGTTNPPDSLGVTPDTSAVLSGLDYSTTYYWSVVPQNAGGVATGCGVYSFTTVDAPPVPVNDECTSAVEVTSFAPVSGSTRSATQSMAADSCAGFIGDANDDVWFKFTALQAGDASIELTPDLNFDGVMAAYSGNCGALVPIACADAGIGGDIETLELTGLTAGTVYYFRVYAYGHALSEGTFTLRASGTALPVNLVNFKGERDGSRNVLSWTTETEQNNKGFELQRSADGKNFGTLGFIKSSANNGNSSSVLKYQFADEKPFAGNAYYRLKQVDIDGRSSLSNVVLLKGLRANTLVMSNVYPNPARTELKVILGAPSNDKVNVIITDMAGKVVMRQSAQLLTGDNNISLNVARLPSGSYMIKAVCASGCETSVSKFVKR